MVHVFTYIINAFSSIIVFLYRHLRSDDNPIIYCHITTTVGNKLVDHKDNVFNFSCSRYHRVMIVRMNTKGF